MKALKTIANPNKNDESILLCNETLTDKAEDLSLSDLQTSLERFWNENQFPSELSAELLSKNISVVEIPAVAPYSKLQLTSCNKLWPTTAAFIH